MNEGDTRSFQVEHSGTFQVNTALDLRSSQAVRADDIWRSQCFVAHFIYTIIFEMESNTSQRPNLSPKEAKTTEHLSIHTTSCEIAIAWVVIGILLIDWWVVGLEELCLFY